MLYFATTGYLTATSSLTYNDALSYLGTFTGARGNAMGISSVQLCNPYGHNSIPINNIPALIIPVNGSHKASACLGYFLEIPQVIPHTAVAGESWLYSSNYLLFAQVDGLRAYKYGNVSYNATLPNGEFLGQMMQNRIDEIENMIAEINANYATLLATFNAHTHSYSPGGGTPTPTAAPSSPLSQTDLTSPATLTNDTTYISNGNYLINNEGTLYGE